MLLKKIPSVVLSFGLFCVLSFFGISNGQFANAMDSRGESLVKDKASIKSMTGCYQVTYQNAETFSPNPQYQFQDRFKTGGLEWIVAADETDHTIDLQHLLMTPVGVIKHWRQHWVYENTSLFDFIPDLTWNYQEIPLADVEGQWTQKVYQVDDSPRYECSAPWIHWGQKNYWECEANAPLPRRELARKDYNLLRRTNRHEIVSSGHFHHEDNVKVMYDEETGRETTVAMEKGYNIYKRVEESRCQEAQDWWKTHKDFWFQVKTVWEEFYQAKNDLYFKKLVDGKHLWEKIFELDQRQTENPSSDQEALKREIRQVIQSFLN